MTFATVHDTLVILTILYCAVAPAVLIAKFVAMVSRFRNVPVAKVIILVLVLSFLLINPLLGIILIVGCVMFGKVIMSL
jgi:hypothetical protein